MAEKPIIIFYSLTGNTKFIAQAIAEITSGEILELKLEKEFKSSHDLRTVFWGGKQVVTKEKPKLLPLTKNIADYNLIILGTPVWAFSVAPALRTFLSQNKLTNKKIALFCCHDGMPGKALANLKSELTGNEIIGDIAFREPLGNQAENKKKLAEWLTNLNI